MMTGGLIGYRKAHPRFVPNSVKDDIQAVTGEKMTLPRSIIAPFTFKPYFRGVFLK